MKLPIAKRAVAQSVGIALLGSTAVIASNTASADDLYSGPGTTATNNADPGEVLGRQNSLFNPVSVRSAAGETEVTVSGYVRASFIYDTEGDVGDSFAVSSIPTTGSDGDPHFRAHARQSRLRIRSSTELEGGGTVKTHLEGDFFGAGGNESFSNSTALRLRHAYLTVGGWTFGQTWTNFMDFVAYPGTVDFFGPAGKSFARQGQIRYTFANGLAFSIENPETDGFTADGGRVGESRPGGIGEDNLPDFTAAWRGGPGGVGGSYEFAAIVRSLGVGGDVDDNVAGGGVLAAGAWDLGVGTVAASVVTGSGIGRYIINGFANEVFVDAEGDVDAITATGYSVSYNHKWSESATSLIALGGFVNSDDTGNNGTDNLQTLHLNYQWSTASGVSYGAEAIVGNIEDTDGNSGTATRLAFGAQFNF